MFDIYTIIFLALAVFIFLRLRSVLGQRTGRERPPYDPYFGARRGAQPRRRRQGSGAAAAHHRNAGEARRTGRGRARATIAGRASPSRARALAAGLDAIARGRPDFDAKHFLTGARAAYEMIVTAFADRRPAQL